LTHALYSICLQIEGGKRKDGLNDGPRVNWPASAILWNTETKMRIHLNGILLETIGTIGIGGIVSMAPIPNNENGERRREIGWCLASKPVTRLDRFFLQDVTPVSAAEGKRGGTGRNGTGDTHVHIANAVARRKEWDVDGETTSKESDHARLIAPA
jgi:hypothetical protein